MPELPSAAARRDQMLKVEVIQQTDTRDDDGIALRDFGVRYKVALHLTVLTLPIDRKVNSRLNEARTVSNLSFQFVRIVRFECRRRLCTYVVIYFVY